MNAPTRHRTRGLVLLFVFSCGCGATTAVAGPDDAGGDAPSLPACLPEGACAAPLAATLLPVRAGGEAVTERVPVAYYQEGPGIGCGWILVRSTPTGALVVETNALGPGWRLTAPSGFSCAGSACTLEEAPSGRYTFELESCTSARGGGETAARTPVVLDLDVASQLVTLGYSAGGTGGSGPSVHCSACD